MKRQFTMDTRTYEWFRNTPKWGVWFSTEPANECQYLVHWSASKLKTNLKEGIGND